MAKKVILYLNILKWLVIISGLTITAVIVFQLIFEHDIGQDIGDAPEMHIPTKLEMQMKDLQTLKQKYNR